MNSNNDWKDRRIGAMWRKPSKAHFSGEIEINGEKISIIVFEVAEQDKHHDRSPDFVIYKSKPKGQEAPKTKKTSKKKKKAAKKVVDEAPGLLR